MKTWTSLFYIQITTITSFLIACTSAQNQSIAVRENFDFFEDVRACLNFGVRSKCKCVFYTFVKDFACCTLNKLFVPLLLQEASALSTSLCQIEHCCCCKRCKHTKSRCYFLQINFSQPYFKCPQKKWCFLNNGGLSFLKVYRIVSAWLLIENKSSANHVKLFLLLSTEEKYMIWLLC